MSPRFLACITDGPVKWESMGEGTMIGSNKEKQTEVMFLYLQSLCFAQFLIPFSPICYRKSPFFVVSFLSML